MKIIRTIRELQDDSESARNRGERIGLVPTMGYLHEGHLSLVREARGRADRVILSIYVNPTQFAPGEDLDQYPRDFDRDEALCRNAGVDVIFYPSNAEIYPEGYITKVSVDRLTRVLCGASRPAHFDGVTTICSILFHAAKPHFAVFGQKDYQQCRVIRRMVRDLHFDIGIVMAPIVREPDGLAMSSRNSYLSPEERQDALLLGRALKQAEQQIQGGERNTRLLIDAMRGLIETGKNTRIDYIHVVDPDSLQDLEVIEKHAVIALAVFTGRTRLIDNLIVQI